MAATVARAGFVSPERVTHPKSIVNARTSVPEPTPLSALIVSHPGGTTGAGEGGGFSCSSNSFNAHYAEAPQKLIPLTQSFKVASLSQNPTTQLLDRHRLNMEHGTVRDPNLSHSLTIVFNTSWWQPPRGENRARISR
jgi:hypothetical protein